MFNAKVKEKAEEVQQSLKRRKEELAEMEKLANNLSEVEQDLYVFMKLCPVFMVIVDREKFIRVNSHICDVLGFEPNELKGKSWLEVVCPGSRTSTVDTVAKMNGKPLLRFKNHMLRKDGSCVEVEWTTSPWTDNKLYAVGVITGDGNCVHG